jgi:hypothetical protein
VYTTLKLLSLTKNVFAKLPHLSKDAILAKHLHLHVPPTRTHFKVLCTLKKYSHNSQKTKKIRERKHTTITGRGHTGRNTWSGGGVE